jgi:hypothetical protein
MTTVVFSTTAMVVKLIGISPTLSWFVAVSACGYVLARVRPPIRSDSAIDRIGTVVGL